MKGRFILLMLLIIASAGTSFFFSRDIYRFYMKVWYQTIQGTDHAMIRERCELLKKEGKHDELDAYLTGLEAAFHDQNDTLRLVGDCYLKMGNISRGAELVAASMANGSSGGKVSPKALKEGVRLLYREGYYGDVAGTIMAHDLHNDPELFYLAGMSYFHTEKYGKAKEMLQKAMARGYPTGRLWYYMGFAAMKSGDRKNAERWLLAAHRQDRKDMKPRKALAELYQKRGAYGRAASLMEP